MAKRRRQHEEDFKEMELWEHLSELRSRLIRSAFYVVLGLIAAWQVFPWIWDIFFAPLEPIMRGRGWKIVYVTFTQGFMLRLQVSLIAGLVIAIPLVTLELWGFVAPGLTRNERRACYVVFPLSVFFFLFGVATGYLLMNVTVGYFAQYIPENVDLYQDPTKYIVFLIKMVVGFGICFQMPVILMFLSWLGLVSSAALRRQWRIAVVACFAVAAIATPGGDPLTMCIMAAPLAVLYMGSLVMCSVVERARARADRRAELSEAARREASERRVAAEVSASGGAD